MDLLELKTHAQIGDLAELVSPSNKVHIVRLTPGGTLQTHRGVVRFDDLIGQPWGSQIVSHIGSPFFLLQPSLSDLLRDIRRNTQILYAKDIGFILISMGIGPGTQVLEAGTGSGALTTAFSWAVGPQGRVISYEVRPEMQRLASKNLERLGLLDRVTLKLKDIESGFDESGVDALFLDVPNPHDYIDQVLRSLKPGGYFGSILPTTNQVSQLLTMLISRRFAFIDVCEVMLRYYKPVPNRLRPTDRMVAHTGYLVFARPMLATTPLPSSSAEQEDEATAEDDFSEADQVENSDLLTNS